MSKLVLETVLLKLLRLKKCGVNWEVIPHSCMSYVSGEIHTRQCCRIVFTTFRCHCLPIN